MLQNGWLGYCVVVPALAVLSIVFAINVLWLVPLAALLGCICFASRSRFLEGRHVLITGGSSGIGLAMAKRCVSEGARRVTIVGRNQGRLEAARKEIEVVIAQGVAQCQVDVLSLDVREATQEQMNGILGGEDCCVDLLVCSAGDSGQPDVLEKISEEDWKTMYELNVVGCMKSVKAVLPGMKLRGNGSICLIGSMASQLGIYGTSTYTASKFALRGFAEVLRMELIPSGITVSLACPPDTDTPMLERENETKPVITKLISADGGTWTADTVADGVLRGISRGEFLIGFGLDGFMLNTVTAGLTPVGSPLQLVLEVVLLPLFRLIALWYGRKFNSIIIQHSHGEGRFKLASPKQQLICDTLLRSEDEEKKDR